MAAFMMGPVAAGKQVVAIFQQVKAVADKMEAEFAVAEQATALLNSTLKATGGAAGLTAGEIQDLAAEFQRTTKYEADMVLGMENVLLGFKNIKGDNFKKASLEILNMATVMNMDLTSAAQAVGKALDDPIKGIDSLSRQGFRFSDEQKAMLKTMVETGRIAEAQGVILEELSTTYGGAAEAAGSTATAIKVKLSNAIGDINEEIGRSIANNLKPWREKWLELATAIGASAKAQNDFREAMAKDKAGVATDKDRLVIAKNYLATLQEERQLFIDTEGAVGDLNDKEIKSQQDKIRLLEIEIARRDGLRTAAQKAVDDEVRKQEEAARRVEAIKEKQAKDAQEAIENIRAMDEAYEEWGKEVLANYGISSALNPIFEDTLDLIVGIQKETDMISSGFGEWTIAIGEAEYALKDISDTIIPSIMSAYTAYTDLVQNGNDKEIAALQEKMDQMRKNGKDTTAIEAEIKKKKNEFAEKEFNAKKLTSIASIAINTSEGAMKAYTLDPTGILSAIVIAAGAVEAGLVTAQSYTPFATGGYVDQPTRALVGEAGGEWILNKAQMSGLVKNGIGGGGMTIVQNINGSIWNSRELEAMAVSAQARASRGF